MEISHNYILNTNNRTNTAKATILLEIRVSIVSVLGLDI